MNADPDILEFKNDRKPLVGLVLTSLGVAVLAAPFAAGEACHRLPGEV